MLVDDGLAMIADTRTNAGVDNISSYRKLHIYQSPGERILAVATAGNLSVTQTALAMVAAGVKLPDSTELETLQTAPTLFRAAQSPSNASLINGSRYMKTGTVFSFRLPIRSALPSGIRVTRGVYHRNPRRSRNV